MIEGDVRYISYEFSLPGKIRGKINSTLFVLDSARSQFVFIHARFFRQFPFTVRLSVDSAPKMASAPFLLKDDSSEIEVAEEEKSPHSSPRLSNSNLFRVT